MNLRVLFFLLTLFCLISCGSKPESTPEDSEIKRPNMLWIVCEDISPLLSFYGDGTAETPVLDQLASESVVYDNAFAVVGVCGPSRSSIITGMYPTSLGTMHMRTGRDIQSWGTREYATETGIIDLEGNDVIQYSAVIPEEVRCFPELLRKAGYFTSNNQKTDYQFAAPVTVWDQNNAKAHWRNRKKGQPFFSVFNFNVTHESQIWKRADEPLTVSPDSVPVPPYFQDTPTSRNDIARVYSNIETLDNQIGKLIDELKADGLYDDTIIFFYSDHGGPLPRQKRELYNSGLHVPFMVKGFDGNAGRNDRMTSFIDLAPTVLSLAGVEIPDYIQGNAFLGAQANDERDYVLGTSDRFDGFTDRSRTVFTEDFIYIENDFPEKTWYKDIEYRKNVPMMVEMLRFRESEKLNKTQLIWFEDKPKVELYDRKSDPHNLNNLATNPEFQNELEKHQKFLSKWREEHQDLGMLPEAQLIEQMWPNMKQPETHPVIQTKNEGKIQLSTSTQGASIAYFISDSPNEQLDFNSGWQVYNEPITVPKGSFIYTMAQRIGFKESKIDFKKW